jgi:hypothetical protein
LSFDEYGISDLTNDALGNLYLAVSGMNVRIDQNERAYKYAGMAPRAAMVDSLYLPHCQPT